MLAAKIPVEVPREVRVGDAVEFLVSIQGGPVAVAAEVVSVGDGEVTVCGRVGQHPFSRRLRMSRVRLVSPSPTPPTSHASPPAPASVRQLPTLPAAPSSPLVSDIPKPRAPSASPLPIRMRPAVQWAVMVAFGLLFGGGIVAADVLVRTWR